MTFQYTFSVWHPINLVAKSCSLVHRWRCGALVNFIYSPSAGAAVSVHPSSTVCHSALEFHPQSTLWNPLLELLPRPARHCRIYRENFFVRTHTFRKRSPNLLYWVGRSFQTWKTRQTFLKLYKLFPQVLSEPFSGKRFEKASKKGPIDRRC